MPVLTPSTTSIIYRYFIFLVLIFCKLTLVYFLQLFLHCPFQQILEGFTLFTFFGSSRRQVSSSRTIAQSFGLWSSLQLSWLYKGHSGYFLDMFYRLFGKILKGTQPVFDVLQNLCFLAKTTTRSELIPIAYIVKFTKKQKGRV